MFTDEEHRILLSAMGREQKLCEKIDKSETGTVCLTNICQSINTKIYNIQHKYNWHYLNKTPNILPNKNSTYICVFADWNKYCQNMYGLVDFNANGDWCIGDTVLTDIIVHAWKYMEVVDKTVLGLEDVEEDT